VGVTVVADPHADPAGHAWHSPAPAAALNLPGLQSVQADAPAAAKVPAAHCVGVTVVADPHAEPAGHTWHSPAPSAALNRPVPQFVQADAPAAAKVPATHCVGVAVVSDPHADPAGQPRQSEAPMPGWYAPGPHGTGAPVVVLLHLVPTGHTVQVCDASGLWYPSPHAVHCASPALDR
jgi:hypothetical protein